MRAALAALLAPALIVVALACGGSGDAAVESTAASGSPTVQPATAVPDIPGISPVIASPETSLVAPSDPAAPPETSTEPDGDGVPPEAGPDGTPGTTPGTTTNDTPEITVLPARGTAYLALTGPVGALDPSNVTGGSLPDALVRVLFAGLFRLTVNGIEPDLVDSWTASPDGLVHTFVLKEGLVWTDGVPLTARDAEFGILRSLSPAPADDPTRVSPDAELLASIIRGGADYLEGAGDITSVGVRATDDVTLVIETTAPAAFLPSVLARPAAFPQPRHVMTSDTAPADGAEPVTSGPFRVISRVAGGNLVLARNPNYDGPGITRLDGIAFVSAQLDASADMVNAGIVNAIAGLAPPRSVSDKSLAPNTAIEVVPGNAAYSLRFDVSRPPFNNILVRRAFGAAIDRAALIAEAVTGPARAATTLTPPEVPGAVASGSGIGVEYDLQRARDLLAEAGFADFQTLGKVAVLYAPGEPDRALAESVSRSWQEAFGLTVSIETYGGAGDVRTRQASPAVWIERHEGPYMDADGWLRTMYRSDSALNIGGYAEPAFDAAVDQGATFTDPIDRARAYRQAETILVAIDVAVIPLYIEDAYRWSQDGLVELLAPDGSVLIEAWYVP